MTCTAASREIMGRRVPSCWRHGSSGSSLQFMSSVRTCASSSRVRRRNGKRSGDGGASTRRPAWTELLDVFHGVRRLGKAAKAIWRASEEATVTGEHRKTVLPEKKRVAALVLKPLEYHRSVADAEIAKELTKSINYLVRHKREGRLGYAEAK
jgi:hypothetical protein